MPGENIAQQQVEQNVALPLADSFLPQERIVQQRVEQQVELPVGGCRRWGLTALRLRRAPCIVMWSIMYRVVGNIAPAASIARWQRQIARLQGQSDFSWPHRTQL